MIVGPSSGSKPLGIPDVPIMRLHLQRAAKLRPATFVCETNAQFLVSAPNQLTQPAYSPVLCEGKEELAWERDCGVK